jgi:Flp pilus assembly protein TadB
VLGRRRLYNRVTVPLSEREQKILQEIERDLYQEDPTFARDQRRAPRFGEGTKARLGALVFVCGFLTLIAYFVVAVRPAFSPALSLVLGVASFAAMVTGIVVLVSSLRALAGRSNQPRDRLTQALKRWESRIRERYKRP